jgi:IS30 family transposase
MSAEQRAKLSAAQIAYVTSDPRWPEHRNKLAAAQEATRFTLYRNEVDAIVQMRSEGRSFDYIAVKIGVCKEVIGRELKAIGICTAAIKSDRSMTLYQNEVEAIVQMRSKGRTFDYIAEEIRVCRKVIGRELKTLGVSTARVKAGHRARRGAGFWRCFDPV